MFKNNNQIKILTCFLVFILSFTYVGTLKVSAESDLNLSLRENIIQIENLELNSDFSDLDPLKTVLENKKIIALGESTSGAKEFYLFKSRIIRFLVEEMEYTKLAIDRNFTDIEIINNYINGKGDIEDALWELKPFPWTPEKLKENQGYRIASHTYLVPFTTEEFRDMLVWMREYNRKVDDEKKIKVYGIGFENPKKSAENLIEYIEKVDKEKGKAYKKRFNDLRMVHSLNFKYPHPRPVGLLSGMMEELNDELNTNENEYISNSLIEEYENAKKNLETITQWISYSLVNLNRGMNEAINIKEEYLSDNVKWILDRKSQNGRDGLIIWSDNKHISKDTKNYTSMGKHLYSEFKDDYYALGLDFFKGRFRAYGVDIWGNPISNFIAKFDIDKSKEEYLSYQLEKTGIPISFLDFKRSIEDESIKEILNKEQLFHNISLMYPGKYTPNKLLPYWTHQYVKETPIKSYDGFFFVNEISETKGLHDKRDTKIENGDKEIINHYRDIIAGQIGTILAVLLVIVLIVIWLVKKWKKRKVNKGARYPGSSRWD